MTGSTSGWKRSAIAGAVLVVLALVAWRAIERGEDVDRNSAQTPDDAAAIDAGERSTGSGTSSDGETPGEASASGPANDRVDGISRLVSGRVLGEGAPIAAAEVLLIDFEFSAELLRLFDSIEEDPRHGSIPNIEALIPRLRSIVARARETAPRAKADADGRFAFSAVEPGAYRLLAHRAGWQFRLGDGLLVRRGTPVERDVELVRGATIAGRVIAAGNTPVAGRVVRAEISAGSSMYGFLVEQFRSLFDGAAFRGDLEATTDAEGRFVFDTLAPGRYDLLTRDRGGVIVRAGGVATGSNDVLLAARAPGSVEGTLLDELDAPLVGIVVELAPSQGTEGLGPFGADFGTLFERARVALEGSSVRVKTNRGGEFRLGPLAPGSYRMNIESPEIRTVDRRVDVPSGEPVRLGVLRASRGGTIRGRVSSPEGAPIAGAAVVSVPENSASEWAVFSEGEVRRATTDANGEFILAGLAGGTQRLLVRARGRYPFRIDADPGATLDDIRLEPGITVSGRVRSAATDGPIAGARVRGGNSSVETDGEGRFRLDGFVSWFASDVELASSPVEVVAAGANGIDDSDRWFVKVSARGFESTMVHFEARASGELDIVLSPSRFVRGRLLAPSGEPVSGVPVRLARSLDEAEALFDLALLTERVTLSGDEGRFRISTEGLVSSAYRVLADHREFARAEERIYVPLENDEAELELRFRPGSIVRGVVRVGAHPYAGAKVVLARINKEARDDPAEIVTRMMGFARQGRVVVSGAEGKFEIPRVGEGDYVIRADAFDIGESRELEVRVHPGEDSEVELVLTPGGEIGGEVVDDSGAPIEGATIKLFREESVDPEDELDVSREEALAQRLTFGVPAKTTTTDRAGVFLFEGVPAGSFSLVAGKPSYSRAVVNGTEAGDEDVEIMLAALGGIAGQVLARDSGDALGEFRVLYTRTDPSPEDLADLVATDNSLVGAVDGGSLDGRFVVRGLSAGDYEIEVHAPGFVSQQRTVFVEPGRIHEADFELDRAARVTGTVLDKVTGAPVSGASVHYAEQGDGPVWSFPRADATTTGPDGRFSLWADPKSLRIFVHSSAFLPLEVTVELSVATPLELRLELDPGISAAGLVRDANGRPYAHRHLLIIGEETKRSSSTLKAVITDENGKFSVGGLVPGSYVLRDPRMGVEPGEVPEFEPPTDQEGLESFWARRDIRLELRESRSDWDLTFPSGS